MKKGLASLLAALTLLGPLPARAQNVPLVAPAGQPIAPAVGAAGVGANRGGGPGVLLTPLGAPALTLPQAGVAPVVSDLSQTGAASARALAVTGSNRSATLAGAAAREQAAPAVAKPGAAEGLVAGALAQPGREAAGAPTTLTVAARLGTELSGEEGRSEGFGRLAAAFDSARKAGRAAEEDDGQAPVAAPKAAPGWMQALGSKVAASAVAGLLPASVVEKLSGGEKPVPAPSNTDEWGGPKHELLTTREQVLRGLKWAMNLVGITAILSWTVGVAQTAVPWPLILPQFILQLSGRVELLTDFGPQAIMAALSQSPLSFLLLQVPMQVAAETWQYTLKGFGTTFIALAAVRPALGWISAKLASLPDLFSFVTLVRRGLDGLGRISGRAFGLAAWSTGIAFAMAHAAEWGVNPLVFGVQGIAGYLLARLAYTARPAGPFPEISGKGLKARLKWVALTALHLARYGVAPFVAHATFAVVTLVPPLLAVQGFASAGALVSTVLSIAGIVALYYNSRLHLKLRSLPSAALGLLFAAAVSLQLGTHLQSPAQTVSLMNGKPAVVQLQDAHPHGPIAQSPMPKPEVLTPEPAAQEPADQRVEELVKKLKPSVVTVLLKQGLGSGVIVDEGGLLVTNEHVVRSAGVGAVVKVRFADGRMVPGLVIAMNADRDLALVALAQDPANPVKYPAAPVAPPGTLQEGQTILTMGSPLGLPFTVSKGIVSGLGLRGISPTYRVQIDAPISQGNSGGPLFDLKGRLVGINGAGIPRGGDLNFAIPVEEVHRAIAQFQATGQIASSYLGVIIEVGDGKMGEGPGVSIEHVRPGSAAERAGLQPGDVVVGANGKAFPPQPMPALNALFLTLGSTNPGDKIALMVLRPQASGANTPVVVTVTLDAK